MNIAIIPARSGSKGLNNKNIKMLNGMPLLAYTIQAALQSELFQEVMVSTDSREYAEIAKEFGAQVPFMRSQKLADDITSSWDVVREVLDNYRKDGREFDTIALLQPTSPLRSSTDIINGFSLMKEKKANLVVGVCEMDHSPLWSNTLPDNLSMEKFIDPELTKLPRQSIPKYYRINGAIYIVKVDYLENRSNIYEKDSFALLMSKYNSIDIDDEFDFKLASMILADKNNM